MRDLRLGILGIALVACRGSDVPALAPSVVTVGEVRATAFTLTGQSPDTYLVTANDRAALAADYAAAIGDASTTVLSANGDGVTFQVDLELGVGRYPLELTARGDHWLVEDALEVVPRGALVDASPGGGCDPEAEGLVACYPFDGDTLDVSGHHLDGLVGGSASYQPGMIGTAIELSAGQVTVADSPLLDVSRLTIEAWIRPSNLPNSTNRAGIVDSEARFGMFVRAGGTLACTASLAVSAAAVIAIDVWTHVACTYDGSTLSMFVNGVQVASSTGGTPLAGGTQGMTIGANNPTTSADRFTGRIDDVRIYSDARTRAELCADAQRTTCP